jgi:suppressor of fused-like protein
VQITNDRSAERYRERRNDSDDDDEEVDVKPVVKTERLSPCEQQDANASDENSIRALSGLHLTFNLEAGSLLPLAIKLVLIAAEFTPRDV